MSNELDTLIAELRTTYGDPDSVNEAQILTLLDALEAMRAQRNGLAEIIAKGMPAFTLAILDAEIARVLRGKPELLSSTTSEK